ncbi:hypothetical protein [Mycobacterium sp. 360MFTsu5.1]|uniref:hypothetical protein n=1 Tax=Mycobacterium sp. 360MFTsu5.1 TaxID=1172186 RepID=UPI0012DDFDB4|nr:hypothetical protein [Mycobacterium sp. 360MFTsu5.1]
MTPMKPPGFGVYGYRRVLVIVSIATLLLAALVTTTRDDHGSTIAALPGATAQPSIPGGGSGGSGGDGGGPPFPMQPPAMPDAPAPYNGGSYPAPYQGNGIDINNPAEQPAQAPQQQSNSQQSNSQQLQPANGQQPPDYDQPLQQPSQQPQPSQQSEQQPAEQEQQQEPSSDQEQRKQNDCEPNPIFGPQDYSNLTPEQLEQELKEQQDAYDKLEPEARRLIAGIRKRMKNGEFGPEIRDEINRIESGIYGNGGTYITWDVDHIIPLRALVKLPQFRRLPLEDQVAIADMLANLYPNPSVFNRSRKDKLPSQWTTVKGEPVPDDVSGDWCKKEKDATQAVLDEVAQRQRDTRTAPKPSPTNQDPQRQQHPTAPPSQAPNQAPSQAPAEPATPAPPSSPDHTAVPRIPNSPRTSPPETSAPRPAPPASDPFEVPIIASTPIGDPVGALAGIGALVVGGVLGLAALVAQGAQA